MLTRFVMGLVLATSGVFAAPEPATTTELTETCTTALENIHRKCPVVAILNSFANNRVGNHSTRVTTALIQGLITNNCKEIITPEFRKLESECFNGQEAFEAVFGFHTAYDFVTTKVNDENCMMKLGQCNEGESPLDSENNLMVDRTGVSSQACLLLLQGTKWNEIIRENIAGKPVNKQALESHLGKCTNKLKPELV